MLLTVAVTGGGSVTGGTAINCPTPLCFESHWPGTVVTLTAAPGPGEVFAGWGGACAAAGTILTCNVTMSLTRNVTATFVLNTLTVTVSGTGTVTSNVPGVGTGISCNPTCADNYNVGTIVTLTATPDPGEAFTGWSGACVGTTPTCVVTMNATQNVSASFGGLGCTDPTATNYNPLAVVDDGSCIFSGRSIVITVDVTDGQGGKATKTLKLTPQ